uniref:MH2 domain-containing protein n=1 Tax=Ditylenchus dipsaci TaxID=166011 RepID=A0A915EIV1_9BILA
MEGGSRLAKAYLRNPVVVVDGSDHEFDGLRIGFNHFLHVASFQQDFCKKIGDGVVIKMDADGNIKAMARGTAPIYVQGKLTPKSANISDNDRIYKIFDMHQFKCSLAEMTSSSDIRSLLFKTCTRIAMVKDGGEDNLSKTPCWFLLVNMIAIDMVRRKLSLPDSKKNKLVSESTPIPSNSPVIAAQIPLISLLTAAIQKIQNGCVEVQLETDSSAEDMMQKLATKQNNFLNAERCDTSVSSIPANYRCRRPRLSKSVVHTNQNKQFYSKLTSPQNRHSDFSHINTSDYESHSNGNGMFDVASSLSYNSSPESDTDSNNSEKQFDHLDAPRLVKVKNMLIACFFKNHSRYSLDEKDS